MGRRKRRVDPAKENYWRELFARFQKSGLAFRRFCELEGISPNTFQYWRRELRQRDIAKGKASTIKKGDNRPSQLQERVEFWKQVIEEIDSYSGSTRQFCRDRGISSGSLHYWKKRLAELMRVDSSDSERVEACVDFVPVIVKEDDVSPEVTDLKPESLAVTNERIEITLSDGTSIAVPSLMPIDTLLGLVNGLRFAVTVGSSRMKI